MPTEHTDADRIDPDHYEPSPSTGWRETTIICGGELPVFAVEDTDRAGDLL